MLIQRLRAFALVVAVVAAVPGAGLAQQPYTLDGKTVRVLLPNSTGGMSDTQTQILLEYIGPYLPGRPTFVVQNIEGAGGVRMLEYMNQLNPATDLIVFSNPSAMPFRARAGLVDPLLYEPRELNWVGSFRGSTLFCLVRTDTGVETLDDLRATPVRFGATSRSGNSYAIQTLIAEQLGAPIESIVGYQGTDEISLAIDRGEVDGHCTNYASYTGILQLMVVEGRARILFQMGPEPRADIDAPYLFDLAMPEEARAFIRSALAAISFAGPFAIPAGSDPEFIDAIRQGFAATMEDPGFAAAATTAGIDLSYQSGDLLSEKISELYATPDAVVQQIGALFFGD